MISTGTSPTRTLMFTKFPMKENNLDVLIVRDYFSRLRSGSRAPNLDFDDKKKEGLRQDVNDPNIAPIIARMHFSSCKKRVVVKRPNYAPPLKENPDFSFSGRSHRFDIYLKHGPIIKLRQNQVKS